MADSGRSQFPEPTFRDHSVPSRAWLKTPRGPPGADAGACASRKHAQYALGAEGGAPWWTSLRRRRIPVGEEVEDSIRHVGCRRFAITSPALFLKKFKNKERSFLRVSGLLGWPGREPGSARSFFFPSAVGALPWRRRRQVSRDGDWGATGWGWGAARLTTRGVLWGGRAQARGGGGIRGLAERGRRSALRLTFSRWLYPAAEERKIGN